MQRTIGSNFEKIQKPAFTVLAVAFALLDQYPQRGYILASLIFCLALFPKIKIQLIGIFSVASMFLLTPQFGKMSIWFGLSDSYENFLLQGLCGLLLFYLVWRLKQFRLRMADRWVGPFILAVFAVGILLLFTNLQNRTTAVGIALGLFFYFCRIIWVVIYDSLDHNQDHKSNISINILPYSLFSQSIFLLPIMSKTALYNGLSASEEEISKTQTSGYLLFMQAALVLFAINYLTNGCKIEIGTFHWQDKAILQTEGWDLWSIFHDSKLLASFDFWQAWKSLYMHFLVTFGWVWGNGNLVVGLYRIMGFSVLRNTQKVWASVSTLDYFQRFAYYFRKTLQRFFFYPAFFYFKNWDVRLRIIFAMFYSVLFGNLIFHAIIWISYSGFLLGHPGRRFFSSISTYSVFCLILTTVLTLSYFRNHWRQKPKKRGFWGHILNLTIILHIYIFIQIFEADSAADLPTQFQFIKTLAGLR